jgi:hypothetical protein
MTYTSPITPVRSRYGAPMGRHLGPDCLDTSAPIYLRRVRINSGGYDAGGAYWGLGQPLWHAQDEDGNGKIFRSPSREAAKAHLVATYPGARFYR